MARRKLMLPRFHGERDARGRRDDDRAGAARSARAGRSASRSQLWPRMQALTQEVVMRAVFGDDEGRAGPAAGAC